MFICTLYDLVFLPRLCLRSDYDAFVAVCDAFHRTFFGADAVGGSATAKRTVPGMQSYLLPPTFYMSELLGIMSHARCYKSVVRAELNACWYSHVPFGAHRAARPSALACLGVFLVPLLYCTGCRPVAPARLAVVAVLAQCRDCWYAA